MLGRGTGVRLAVQVISWGRAPEKDERRVWIHHWERWRRKSQQACLEGRYSPQLIEAQDASDTAVGGWIGVFVEPQTYTVKGKEHRVSFPRDVERAAGSCADCWLLRLIWDVPAPIGSLAIASIGGGSGLLGGDLC